MLRHVLSCCQGAVFTFAYVYSRISIRNGVNCGVSKIPIAIHELTEVEICGLHGDCVIVSAQSIKELDKRVVPCLGSHKDIDGKKYIVLDGEEYSQSLFVDGTITLWQVR